MSENSTPEAVEPGDDLGISEEEAEALLSDAVQAGTQPDTGGDGKDWKSEAEKWQRLAQRHEIRAKQNAQAASKAKTVEQQLQELRTQLSERDEREVERGGKLALAQVHTRLAEGGIARADVAGLLDLVDAKSLLANGQPDEKAIERLASSLLKVAGRASPDPDQGRRGGNAPADMNQLIRRKAGFGNS